ncbi:sensor histidine kinase [Longispora albida]|uniref:sensor histidine kinase n=1 Tax=Longispora albida TaxID=203523 RepID=UPI00037FDDF5|nr:histidine kinase [Longispora albida]
MGTRLRRVTGDLLLAAAACVLDLLMFSYLGGKTQALPTWMVAGYAAAGYAALLWRRQAPVVVFGIMWAHSLVAALTPPLRYFPTVGVLVALFTLALHRGRNAGRAALAGYAILMVFNVMELVTLVDEDKLRIGIGQTAVLATYGLAAWAGGRLVAITRSLAAAEAREAVSAERLRIARELHDIVAHSVTVMILQAAGAQRMLTTDPPRASRAMSEIETIGKQAMDELRRLLKLLRDDDDGRCPTGPQPGLAEVPRLLSGIRGAGITVRFEQDGVAGQLDPGADLAAYRIIQEALTNVTKHAQRGASATVRLAWSSEELTIQVVNGPGHSPQSAQLSALSAGYGLYGLRERAALTGGLFTARPTPDGGFAVIATLPVNSPPQTEPDLPEAEREAS